MLEPTSKGCFAISLQFQLLQTGILQENKIKTNMNSRAFGKTYHHLGAFG